MRKYAINLLVDGLFLVLFLGLCFTGILLQYVLPPRSGHGRSLLWGLGRHDWGLVHFWIAAGAVGAMLLHLALHWSWVWASSLGRLGLNRWGRGARVAGGLVLFGLTVLAVAMFWWGASSQVVRPFRAGPGSDRSVEAATAAGSGQVSGPRRWRGGRDSVQGDQSGPSPRGRLRAGRL